MENFNNEKFKKKERQLENLENLVENHTRTERHLEQYSDIGDKDNKENAREKQDIREKQILELENQIDMLYREYYINSIEFEPVVIIIHDATQMPDCADEYELVEYLNDKLTILRVMRTFVFCTVRN